MTVGFQPTIIDYGWLIQYSVLCCRSCRSYLVHAVLGNDSKDSFYSTGVGVVSANTFEPRHGPRSAQAPVDREEKEYLRHGTSGAAPLGIEPNTKLNPTARREYQQRWSSIVGFLLAKTLFKSSI